MEYELKSCGCTIQAGTKAQVDSAKSTVRAGYEVYRMNADGSKTMIDSKVARIRDGRLLAEIRGTGLLRGADISKQSDPAIRRVASSGKKRTGKRRFPTRGPRRGHTRKS